MISAAKQNCLIRLFKLIKIYQYPPPPHYNHHHYHHHPDHPDHHHHLQICFFNSATGFSPLRYPHFLPELLRGGISNNILIISNILRCFFASSSLLNLSCTTTKTSWDVCMLHHYKKFTTILIILRNSAVHRSKAE